MRSLLQVHSRSSPASPMDQSPRLRAPHMCGSHLLQAQRLAWGFTGFWARSSSSPRLPRRRIHVPRRSEGGALLSRNRRWNPRDRGRKTLLAQTTAMLTAQNGALFATIRARAQHFHFGPLPCASCLRPFRLGNAGQKVKRRRPSKQLQHTDDSSLPPVPAVCDNNRYREHRNSHHLVKSVTLPPCGK